MKIPFVSLRTKLLVSYAGMLLIVSLIALAVYGTATRWRATAGALSATYEQGLLAEKLRWDILRLIEEGRHIVEGSERATTEMNLIEGHIDSMMIVLRRGAQQSPDSAVITDHLGGFDEAYRELVWMTDNARAQGVAIQGSADRVRWESRLREMVDEVDDAAAVLEQYFRDRNRHTLAETERLRRFTVVVSSLAALILAAQLLAMFFLLRRWVTSPVTALERAAEAIGAGNLDVSIPDRPEREWRKVADALRDMMDSLALMQQQVRTQERLGAIGEVAAYTAHNIRNPLASIRAMAQVALPDAESSPALKDSLTDIIHCVDKMEEWVAGLLGFAKPLTLEMARCDINQVAEEVVLLLQGMANRRGVRLSFLPGSPMPLVNGDRSLLEQALYAIISNALEATAMSGQVELRTASHPVPARPEWVHITVSDTGEGIPPDLLHRVFKPFVTSKRDGSGLGLAQAKKIIDVHLGQIDIASIVGQGTTITIKLPATKHGVPNGTDSDHR